MSRKSLILSFLFLFTIYVLTTADKSKCVEKLIIDTDAGSDDGLAILLLLNAPKAFKRKYPCVVAITCTYGNTKEENVEVNVLKTLTIANRSDIPVYAGAKRPLLQQNFSNNHSIFGKDGFGDAKFNEKILGSIDRSKHAALALVELSKQFEGELSVLVLGPTTNVALAISLDEGFIRRVRHFYVMGGSVAGFGNRSPGVEFNFAADPEANYLLFRSVLSSKQLTLFPWEAGLESGYSKEWRKNVFGKHKNRVMHFLNDIEGQVLNSMDVTYIPTDAMLVGVMLMYNSIVSKDLETRVEPVIDGAARGSILVEYRLNRLSQTPNARIVRSIRIHAYEALLVCAFVDESQCAAWSNKN